MKPSTFLLVAILAALLAASAMGQLASKPPMPSRDEVARCLQAVRADDGLSCKFLSYDAKSCCEYISGLESACAFVSYYRSQLYKGIVTYVCDSASSPSSP